MLSRSSGDEIVSTAEEHNPRVYEGETDSIKLPIVDLATVVWRRRYWLTKVIGLGTFVAIVIALLIPNQYTSTAQLMPPDQQSLSNSSMLSTFTADGPTANLVGGLVGARTPAGTFIGILSSQTVQDDIIDRFNLRRVYRCKFYVYHCKLYVDTRKILTERTSIVEDRKSGIIGISVSDHDPNRARDMAKVYVEELDRLLNTLSTSSARRERIFLEERLKSIKSDLDVSSVALSQFSSRNATLDPQTQGQSILGSAERLQGELIAAESELSGLKAMYSDGNVQVRQARARVDELQSQLQKMGGEGESVVDRNLNSGQFEPSIRKLPLLGATYADLYRRVTMQENIYETLTKQYELAKVEEAKEIPPMKVLDEPALPERKSFPPRSIIVVVGFILSALAGTTWILCSALWALTDDSHPVKEGVIALSRLVRSH
jgi:capsule polysaccharide export protein KpsE/RkpR